MDSIIDLDQLIEHYKADPAMTHAKWVQWAVVCAERALPLFTSSYPDDDRPAKAIAAAKAWLHNPTKEAAYAADAADAAAAAYAAAYAARAAARAAANAAADAANAANAAARTAANAANAANAAARTAAYAANAANAAARTAANAARTAAYAAAYAAETQWQAFRLMEIYHA